MEEQERKTAINVGGISVNVVTDDEAHLNKVHKFANEIYMQILPNRYKREEFLAEYSVKIAEKLCKSEYKPDQAYDKIKMLENRLKKVEAEKAAEAALNKDLKAENERLEAKNNELYSLMRKLATARANGDSH